MIYTFSVEIDLAREIYQRLLSKVWRKIEKNLNLKQGQTCVAEIIDENNFKFNGDNIN